MRSNKRSMISLKSGMFRHAATAAGLLASLLFPGAAFAATDEGGMDRGVAGEKKMLQLFGRSSSSLAGTDPDFAAMRDRLVYGEIAWQGTLDDKARELITLAVLTTTQGLNGFKAHVEAALNVGVTPVEIKETVYQCAPYVGFPKAEAALELVNEAFRERNIPLPLPSQATTTEADRFEKGLKLQKETFGERIEAMHKTAPENQKHLVVNHLSAFCFGDVYTRTGLDMKMRELLTFSIIAALGGAENQLRGHTQGNVNVGNTKENLIDVITLSMPYIGFPRTLNALAVVNAVIPEKAGK